MTDLIERYTQLGGAMVATFDNLEGKPSGEWVKWANYKALLDALEAKEREVADLIHDMERLHDSLNGEAAARIQAESAVARIANIAARLAEIARSVHIGDLERAEISALELELVKETL